MKPKRGHIPTCPHCGSAEVMATTWSAWLPKSGRFTTRVVVDGLWGCIDCKDAGRQAFDFEPVWLEINAQNRERPANTP